MSASLVGSEMCIRDRLRSVGPELETYSDGVAVLDSALAHFGAIARFSSKRGHPSSLDRATNAAGVLHRRPRSLAEGGRHGQLYDSSSFACG
eukprot:54161-Alexandrium_andersonii.AAC.1